MQYSRNFGRSRLIRSIVVGLALCVATVTAAEAGKRQVRHVARAKMHRVVSGGDDVATSSRYAAIVIDDKTGKTLYAKNAEALRHPASLTKMMTLYILFEEMQKRKVSLMTRFTVSPKASAQAPSKLGLRPGQTIAAEDAIRALVTKSANDVAVTVAENLGGTEEAFARRMTQTARKIGMRGTTFYNASGLPNDAQFTTARDMVVLGRALQERFPNQYRYFSTRSFAWGNAVHGNHNKLLYRLEGIDGIKTGYTNASGFNLVSSIRRDGRHVVAAVMGGSSGRARDDHMAQLLATYLPQASSGAKVSSVFKENGVRRAAELEDDDGVETTVADASESTPMRIPAPAPSEIRAAPASRAIEQVAAIVEEPTAPLALAPVPPPAPVAAPVFAPNKPRIAASDIVPIQPSEAPTRSASADHGAAVAMARAILLPDAGKPMRAAPEAPVRVATTTIAVVPTPAPAVSHDARPPVRPTTLAEATVSSREVEVHTTASVPRNRVEEPVAKTSGRSGWMVQIGAYDTDRAARTALDKAKDKVGSALGRADGFTEQATTGSGRVWRARFAGFQDQKRAEDACKALKRKNISCLALRQ